MTTRDSRLVPCITLIVLMSVTACVTEKSSDSRLSSLMHQCFRTTGDAVLYQSNKCPPQSGLDDTSTCVTVKYLSDLLPPAKLNDFKSNGAAASVAEQLTPRANGGLLVAKANVTVLGTLPKGSSFTVDGMHRFSHPEQGAMWITAATIRDGEFAGRQIILPWEDLFLEFHGDGAWIKDFLQREPFIRDPYRPQIDSKRMVPCVDQ